ncbi:MAG: thiol reductant ABC exporter subunit CydD [Methylophaga sp.]|uniref:thiol reductant ABC exporter subunit CydD n=1 Tax=Methylophaga sp. TaxID=2024840 RepID=UPI00299CD82A|nr:thiol reductant ABC exporter subunit CydD [Methylophaga sp.]MDX1750022.1 thiol reductant ABC exporter subunit CydD [Methylophaga sp.]
MKDQQALDKAGRLLLKQLTQKQRSRLLLAVFMGVLATIAMIVQWYALAQLTYDLIIQQQPFAEQSMLMMLIVLSLILRSVLIRAQEHYSQLASLHAREHLREQVLSGWRQTSALIHSQRSPGSAASQLIEDVESMDGYFARFWPQQLLSVLTPLLILIVVFYYNWLAALFLLVAAPLIPLFMMLIGWGAEAVNQRFFYQRQRLAGHFLDRVKHLTTLKLFAAENEALTEVEERSQDYRQVVMKTLKLAFLSSAVLEFFTSVAIASIAIYIGFALFGSISWGPAAEITLFSGLFILLLAPEFFQPIRNLSQFYHDRAAALAAASHIATHLPDGDTNLPTEDVFELTADDSSSTLIATNLGIGYQPGNVLQDPINLKLSRGQCLVINGPSGCGKTTLLHTLAGYLPPLSGKVLLNNQPMGKEAIRYLPQKPWIINGSWAENLTVLAPDATEKEMHKVLNQLGLESLISYRNNDLESQLNEHGEGLSGGQLQRLALARVLLSPAPLVLLDEPTASLDAESRQYVLAALLALKPQCILVISSHDADVLALADQQLTFARRESD